MKNKKTVLGIAFMFAVAATVYAQYDRARDFRAVQSWDRSFITITGYRGKNTTVNIPPEIQRTPVREIGDDAFNNKGLTGVEFPKSVTAINIRAFANNLLPNVTIPDSVRTIGESAFSNNRLTDVIIPYSVRTIGERAFANNLLSSVTIPDSVRTIGERAFTNNQLTDVTIPNSVTSIGISVFANNQLTSVAIPDSVTYIGAGAFANNPLISITIGNGISSLNENVFTGSLRNVTRISIGANVNLRGISDDVWQGFSGFYQVNGNRAGTYTLSNGRWSAQYR